MTSTRSRFLALTVAFALVGAACGSSGTDTATQPGVTPVAPSAPAPSEAGSTAADPSAAPAEPTDAPAAPAESDLPDINVIDVATDAQVNLQSLATGDKPILLWFYAPH